MPKTNWRTHGVPFLEFTEELTEQWIEQGFTKVQCQDWLGIGMQAKDAFYCKWLESVKKKDSEWVLNYGDAEALKQEYKQYQLKELESLNTPNHSPRVFSKKTLLITVLIAVIALYLLTN